MKNDSLEKRIAELESRMAALEKKDDVIAPVPNSNSKEKPISPKEFLINHPFSGEVEATFSLCFYAEYVLHMESFNIGDIEQLFRTAKVPAPTNLNDKINKNIQKGFLTEAAEKKNGKKAWLVTMTGEKKFKETNKSQ